MSRPGRAGRDESPAALSLGLVGAGRWGAAFIRTIAARSDLRLAGVASRTVGTAALIERHREQRRQQHRAGGIAEPCRVFDDWRRLLRMRGLDAVIVATPPAAHAEPVRAALAAGIPVLVEKPLTLSLAQADALCETQARSGTPAMVDHTQLFAPGVRAFAAALEEHGPAVRLDLRAGGWGPFRRDVTVLWDWGAHEVALLLQLLGPLRVVTAEMTDLPGKLPNRQRVRLQLAAATPDGEVPARVAVSNALAGRERSIEATLPAGALVYREYPEPALLLRTGDADAARLPFPARPPLDCVLDAFADCLRGAPVPSDLRFGREVVAVLTDCARACAG